MIDDYPHQMAGHCGSGAMRDLLHWHGLGWDGPVQEGLVLALGGTLSLSYVRSEQLQPPLYLVGRSADFETDLPRFLGGDVSVRATDDPTTGWQSVREEIDAGRPVLMWADIAELPYLRVQLRMSRHDIVVIGYDEDEGVALVVDNDRAETQRVPLDALARARSSTAFPQPTRHTSFEIIWPDRLPPVAAVAARSFRQCELLMRTGSGETIAGPAEGATEGLVAAPALVADLGTWGELASDDLEVLLFSLGAFIEKAGTGGGLFRRLFAEGASEVARLTEDEATAALADAAARSARTWTAVARAAVARSVVVRDRVAAVVTAAWELPTVEQDLVTALAAAADSLESRVS